MPILCVVERGLRLDLLHRLRRWHKARIARPRKPFRGVIGNAIQRQAVVTAVTVGDDLYCGSAEGIGKAARLRLHIGTRRDAGSQRGKHKRVTPNVRQIGNLLRTHRRSQIGRSCIELFRIGRNHDLLPYGSDLQGEIDPLIAAGRQHEPGTRLRTEAGNLDRHLVGIGR